MSLFHPPGKVFNRISSIVNSEKFPKNLERPEVLPLFINRFVLVVVEISTPLFGETTKKMFWL
jgi:hypothetical protein